MLCTMEAHVKHVLFCSDNAVEPTAVFSDLRRKSFQMAFFAETSEFSEGYFTGAKGLERLIVVGKRAFRKVGFLSLLKR